MDENDKIPGFTLFGSSYRNKLLLPITTVDAIERQLQLAEIETEKQKASDAIFIEQRKLKAAKKVRAKKKPSKAGERDIEIFAESTLENLLDNFLAMESTTKTTGQREFTFLEESRRRFYPIPKFNPKSVLALIDEFENMEGPIRQLAGELELMSYLPPQHFSIRPILLLGEPGIGKTAFALALSKIMGVPFKKLNGSEPSFVLTGSHPTWLRATPGLLLKQIVLQGCAAPMFLVDEIDKCGLEKYPISNTLLDLLEQENARVFNDEYFQVGINASHAIWVLTANTIEGLSEPLLSRVNTFQIPPPDVAQRKRIIELEHKKICELTRKTININQQELDLLAARLDLDLRKVSQIVRKHMIDAISNQECVAHICLPPITKNRIGFL